MNNEKVSENSDIFIPIVSFDVGQGESFFNDLGLNPSSQAVLPFGERLVQLALVNILENPVVDLKTALDGAGAVILLVKSLDDATLGRIKRVSQHLRGNTLLPVTMAVLREPKEMQFKISCTYCKQNVWLRDRNAGQRGNCPQCRKPFLIPAQKSFITSHLMLTDLVELQMVTRSETNYLSLIESMAGQAVVVQGNAALSTEHAPVRSNLIKRCRSLWRKRPFSSIGSTNSKSAK